jgi:hypothetical protein
MRELTAASPRINRVGFRAMLRMLELAPLARGHRRRFTKLEPRERDRFLHGLDKSRFLLLRVVARLFKTLAVMSYYGDPKVLVAGGYDADANIARARALRSREGRQ